MLTNVDGVCTFVCGEGLTDVDGECILVCDEGLTNVDGVCTFVCVEGLTNVNYSHQNTHQLNETNQIHTYSSFLISDI